MSLTEQMLTAFVVLAFACAGLWFGLSGVIEGMVDIPSRQASSKILRDESPAAFWISVGIWLAVGLGLLWVAMAIVRNVLKAIFR